MVCDNDCTKIVVDEKLGRKERETYIEGSRHVVSVTSSPDTICCGNAAAKPKAKVETMIVEKYIVACIESDINAIRFGVYSVGKRISTATEQGFDQRMTKSNGMRSK